MQLFSLLALLSIKPDPVCSFVGVWVASNDIFLKAPYSSKIDILVSKKGFINLYVVLIQS